MSNLDSQLKAYGRILDARARERSPQSVAKVPRAARFDQRSRWLALAAVLGLLAVFGSWLVWPSPRRQQVATVTNSGSDVLVMTSYNGRSFSTVAYDVDSETERQVVLPGQRPGGFPYPIAAIGDKVVYPAWPNGLSNSATNKGDFALVRAVSLSSGKVEDLGSADWFFPSNDGSYLWLARQTPSRRISLIPIGRDGRSSAAPVSLPVNWIRPQQFGSKFLVYDNVHVTALWDPATGNFDKSLIGAEEAFVAVSPATLVYGTGCDTSVAPEYCKSIVLADQIGKTRSIDLPDSPILRGWLTTGGDRPSGAISSNGRYLAVRAIAAAEGQLGTAFSKLAVIDLTSSKISWVEQSEGKAYSPFAWSRQTETLYFANNLGFLGEYDPATHATSTRTARCCGDFLAVGQQGE
jgi:hypothetical protein